MSANIGGPEGQQSTLLAGETSDIKPNDGSAMRGYPHYPYCETERWRTIRTVAEGFQLKIAEMSNGYLAVTRFNDLLESSEENRFSIFLKEDFVLQDRPVTFYLLVGKRNDANCFTEEKKGSNGLKDFPRIRMMDCAVILAIQEVGVCQIPIDRKFLEGGNATFRVVKTGDGFLIRIINSDQHKLDLLYNPSELTMKLVT